MIDDPRFRVFYSELGVPLAAETTTEKDSHGYRAIHGVLNNRAVCSGEFFVNNRLYLRVRTSMSVNEEIVDFSITRPFLSARIIVDFSQYDSTHNVFIQAVTKRVVLR